MKKILAMATAVAVAVALTVTAVVMATHRSPSAPVQQSGTAAGRPSRVPASATIATLVNGKVRPAGVALSAAARRARAAAALRAVKPPKGAVPGAAKPPPVKLGRAAARGRDRLTPLRSPGAPAVKGFNPRTSRVMSAGTSAGQVTYRNADGTRTAMFYQGAVNYRRPDGSWARIDTGLVPVSPGGWRERSTDKPETFARYADANPLLVLPLGAQDSVSLGVKDSEHVAGVASGSSVTYAGARPDADLRVTAGAGAVDAQVILDSPSAPEMWVFPLRLSGLKAISGPGGVIEFADAAGKVIASMPHGKMTDSKIDPRSGTGAMSSGVFYALTAADGGPAIRMSLDSAWLHSPSRVFPVTVDPSVNSWNSGGTTYVLSPFTNDFSSYPEIDAGTYDDGGNVARAFMAFGNVKSALPDDTVLGGSLGLYNSWSYSCSARPVDVYSVTSSWSVTGDKAYPGPSVGTVVGSKSFATGWTPLGSSVSPCPSAWEGITLNQAGTNLVNGWTHGTVPDDGLALVASSTDSYGWKKFDSDQTPNGDPFLSLTYTPYGARYALASTQPVEQVAPTQGGELAIRVTNTGAGTWTPTNGYELSYQAYNAKGQLVANAPVFTPIPCNTTTPCQVGPGDSVTVDAKVNALPVGNYAINFDMYANVGTPSQTSFFAQGIQPFAVGLYVPQPPPVVTGVYPPTGYIAPTVTPELSTTAFSTTGTPITYQFQLTCEPLTGSVCPASVVTSGTLTTPYWTTSALTWNEPYTWTVTATTNGSSATIGPMTITPEVPQPAITADLGTRSGQAFDPQSGNFTTSATDAAVATAGPPLEIERTFNSLDPRTSGAFGAGWSSPLDAGIGPDNDGTGNVVVSLPGGQQMRFGYEAATATYAAPMGSPDVLVHNAAGTWTLMNSSGDQYEFTSQGALEQITDDPGLTQTFAGNAAGEVTTITDPASGRALHLTWSTPAGASSPHVASVTTDPPGSGQAGKTWDYSYTGDELTGVCGPTGDCTAYSYGSGSDYRPAVLDSGPRDYWQLGDASGSSSAADDVDANLGTTDGTYANVTLGAAGPLVGSSVTSAGFDGTNSSVTLPPNVIADQSYVSIGLWFKAATSTASGVLFGYQADPLSDSSGNSAATDPALYVGGNGELYGELWNGSVDPMSSTVNVDDGKWHYAVLTGSGTSQELWLDGTEIGHTSGQISPDGMTVDTAGAGFWANWPNDYVTEGPSLLNTPIGYFDGSIGQVAVYPHPLGQPAIAQQYALAEAPTAELTQVSLPSGRVYQQAAYNPAYDRITSYTDPSGGQWQIGAPLTTGYKASSDALGEATRSVTVVSPAGYDQIYGYDALNGGRLVSYTPGNGDAPETFGYDAAGFLNQIEDSDGNLVTMTNDIHGNVLTRTWYPVEPAAGPLKATAGAEAAGATPASCTTSGAACTAYYSYYYDGGNPLDPQNDELTGAADARSASATDTTYLTTYRYNAAGELRSSTTPATSDFPSGRTTAYVYTTASTAAYGGTGTVPPGLLVSKTTPGGAVTGYEYYADGDLAQVTEPAGAMTGYTYDGLGRPLTATTYSNNYPGGLTTSYSWTADNKPLTVTDPGVVNQVTGVTHTLQDSYAYDQDGNLLSLNETDLTGGDATRTTGYTYNDHGEVASVTQPGGATSGGSPQPQGAASANPAGATTGYTYNDSGQVATMVDPDGNERDYSYNEYGEPTEVTLTTNSTSLTLPGGGSSLVLDSYAYDPAGLLASVTDAMERQTNYFYNGNEQLIATQRLGPAGTGRQTAYTYDGAGNLIETDVSSLPVTGASQTITDDTYDAADRLTSMVADPAPAGSSGSGYANRRTNYADNADDLVTSQTVTGAGGSATTDFGYNAADEMTSRSVVNGSTNDTTTWSYDTLGEALGMTSPDGNAAGATPAAYTTNYAYNQAGQLSYSAGPPVDTQTYGSQTPASTRAVTVYGYDTFGDQTQVKDPDDHVTTTAYDGDGRVTSVTQPSYTPPGSSTAIAATTKYGYDEDGNPTSVTDPAGNTTGYAYDALGDVISQTDPQLSGQPAPGVWSFTYDNDGEQLSATSPTGAQKQATYDDYGDLLTSTDDVRSSSGTQINTTAYTYDYLGDPLTTTTPDGVVTTDTYDHLGELTSTANAYGDATTYGYNYVGQVAQLDNPDGTSDGYAYDAAGNLTAATAYGASAAPGEVPPVLATETMGYDPSGNLTAATDPDGVTTTYAYNAAGELTGQVRPVSSSASDTTGYGYDPAGNQTSVTDGRSNTTWTTYNAWNLPQSVIEPATATATTAADRTWTTAYDADGRPLSLTQPGGITQTYGYDQMGDLTSESGSGASAPTTAQSFGYDTDGNLTSASAPGGTDAFTYNDAGELTGTSGPSGSASFGYNADGLMTSRADAAGTTSYTYDKAGRLGSVADPLTGASLTYGYNADSLPASISYAEGGTAGPAQSLAYNGLQQLTSDTLESASGATIASASHGYNADGDMTSQDTTGYAGAASTTYGYNEADELTSASSGGTTTGYAYDADGDLTQAGTTSYNYDAQDQPVSSTTSAGTTSYGYTLSGALSSVTPPSGANQDFTSNSFGQTVTAPGGVSYAYDALGRLATRTTGSGTADFGYSGTGDTLASDGRTDYSYDPAGDLVAAKASGGTAEAVLTDVHGDLTGLFSPNAPTGLAASAAYSPFGTVTATSGTMPSLGYQGQYTDPSTGDTDMSARWYASSTGTFTSNDAITGMPISTTISSTPYGYVNGNPLTTTDPTGHFEDAPIDAGGALIGELDGSGPEDEKPQRGPEMPPDRPREFEPEVSPGLGPTVSGCSGEALLMVNCVDGNCPGVGCLIPAPPVGSDFFPYGYGVPHPPVGRAGWSLSGAGWSYYPGSPSFPGAEYCADGCYGPAPPPPPPQDCHAGPVPTCPTPPAPESLRDTPHESNPPSNTTNPEQIPRADTIIEPTPTEAQLDQSLGIEPAGISGTPDENGGPAVGQGSGTGPEAAQNPATAGEPATPQAPSL